MTTWKNSGETRANSCRKNDATSTSPRRCRYLWIAPRNQVMSKRRVMLRQAGAPGHQDQPAVPDREELGPRHQGGPGRLRRLDQDLVLGGLGEHHEAAVAQRRDGGQGRVGKPRPVGPAGARLEPEILGAPEHLRCADLVRSQPMPDLSAIGRDALEMQQRHEGFEPRIGWSVRSVSVLTCALRGDVSRQACGCASSGGWFDGWIGNRRRTVAIARRDEARRHDLAQQSAHRGCGATLAGQSRRRH